MKRPGMPLRKSFLRRSSWGINAGKPRKMLPAVNVARQAKKAARYSRKLAQMKRGAGYAEALARAGGRCENTVKYLDGVIRCPSRGPLDAHHVHYQRLGGKELASDLVMVCKDCHRYLEQEARPWRRRGKTRG